MQKVKRGNIRSWANNYIQGVDMDIDDETLTRVQMKGLLKESLKVVSSLLKEIKYEKRTWGFFR